MGNIGPSFLFADHGDVQGRAGRMHAQIELSCIGVEMTGLPSLTSHHLYPLLQHHILSQAWESKMLLPHAKESGYIRTMEFRASDLMANKVSLWRNYRRDQDKEERMNKEEGE
ncbi:hypothetical protein EJ110_NYTH43543 [Nymphaea thermarum]|nr:hypothetical protein EJ110_NYTH43543 [Nymphaea thermarum]